MIDLATIADLDDLLPLVARYREFYGQVIDEPRERAFLGRHLRDGTSITFLARSQGRAVGFVQLFPTHNTVHLGPSFVLEDLFVDSNARRSGIASALLERAVVHARETGAVGMFLETAHENAVAQAVYRAMGWTPEARFLKFNAPL